jgi:hypothetical protein
MHFHGAIRRISLAAISAGAIVFLAAASLMPTACDAAEPQPKGAVYRLGFLWGLPPIAEWIAAFDRGLAELGWVEGQNIIVEHRSAEGISTGCRRSPPNSSVLKSI